MENPFWLLQDCTTQTTVTSVLIICCDLVDAAWLVHHLAPWETVWKILPFTIWQKMRFFFFPCSLLSWTSCAESINLLCVFSIKETKSRVEYIGKGVRKFGQFKWYREDNWVLFGDFKVCQGHEDLEGSFQLCLPL